MQHKFFSEELIRWYSIHGRSLPWRGETSPYAVWVAEVILQQTRVVQGLDYYHRFLAAFPTVGHLAAAPEETVLKVWEGLGYYSRARNMHRAAQQVATEHAGRFPETWQALAALPGFGPYTARAVASFAFGQPAAVLDGNVFRVISRVMADPTPIDRPASRAHYQAIADAWLSDSPSAAFNNAIMDLGATVCTPRSPQCAQCPLAPRCAAHAQGREVDFPVKTPKKDTPTHWADIFWSLAPDGRLALVPQTGKGVWHGLWFPPRAPWPAGTGPDAPPETVGHEVGWLHHVFSHYTLRGRVLAVPAPVLEALPGLAPLHWKTPAERERLPFPSAFQKVAALVEAGQGRLF